MQKKPAGNAAACPGCDCPCCQCKCPYCTLLALTEQLKAAGVCPDVAAEIAANFVQSQCC